MSTSTTVSNAPSWSPPPPHTHTTIHRRTIPPAITTHPPLLVLPASAHCLCHGEPECAGMIGEGWTLAGAQLMTAGVCGVGVGCGGAGAVRGAASLLPNA